MSMIEGRDEFDLARQQHAVAEYVSGHVTNAGNREGFFLRIQAQFAEVTSDGHPDTARSDRHFLVVISGGAARRERVPEPETVLRRDAVGYVRKC